MSINYAILFGVMFFVKANLWTSRYWQILYWSKFDPSWSCENCLQESEIRLHTRRLRFEGESYRCSALNFELARARWKSWHTTISYTTGEVINRWNASTNHLCRVANESTMIRKVSHGTQHRGRLNQWWHVNSLMGKLYEALSDSFLRNWLQSYA